MIGVIQKIIFSEKWPADYFVDRALLLSKLLEDEETNKDTIRTLSEFHTANMEVFQYMRTQYPGIMRIKTIVKKGTPDWGYRYFRLNEQEWAELQSQPPTGKMNAIRPLFFPMLGWAQQGFRRVDALPGSIEFDKTGLPIFNGHEIAEEIWAAAVGKDL